jgi:hypothetical protein
MTRRGDRDMNTIVPNHMNYYSTLPGSSAWIILNADNPGAHQPNLLVNECLVSFTEKIS